MELKDVLDYLGFEADNIEDFKQKFDPEFIRKKNALDNEDIKKTVTGRYFGSQTTNLKKIARERGVELTGEEIEGLQVEEIAGLIVDKMKGNYEDKIKELNESITEPNEALNTLQEKYEKLVNQTKEYKTANKDLLSQVEKIKADKESEIKNYKLNTYKSSVLSQIKYKQGMSDIEKKGWNSTVNENLVFDYDEEGKEIVTDKDGNRIPNPKVSGTFLSPSEAVEDLAIKSGVVSTNPHANGQAVQPTQTVTTPQPTSNNGRPVITKPFFAK